MPKPFPWSLNVGTDICSIARIFNFLAQPGAPRFVCRILTVEERSQYELRIERPLEKWRDMVQFQLRLVKRRDSLGLLSSELAHCFQLRKARKNGVPVVWLQRFRQRQIDGVDSSRTRQKRPMDILEIGMKPEHLRLETLEQIAEQEKQAAAAALEAYHTLNATEGHELVAPIDSDELDALLDLRCEFEVEHKEAIAALRQASAFMAGRFAAKEAVMKAHHNQRLTYHRIFILPMPESLSMSGSRPPTCVVIPEGGELEDGQEVKISISHDVGYATAVCLAADPEVKAVPDIQADIDNTAQSLAKEEVSA